MQHCCTAVHALGRSVAAGHRVLDGRRCARRRVLDGRRRALGSRRRALGRGAAYAPVVLLGGPCQEHCEED